MCSALAPAAAHAATETFVYTGAAQSWTVPADVTSATFELFGGEGRGGSVLRRGGKGARVVATIAVTPGETLGVYVGGAGLEAGPGFNGGGAGGAGVGSGGGATDIRRGGAALANRILVAGGGGGAGAYGVFFRDGPGGIIIQYVPGGAGGPSGGYGSLGTGPTRRSRRRRQPGYGHGWRDQRRIAGRRRNGHRRVRRASGGRRRRRPLRRRRRNGRQLLRGATRPRSTMAPAAGAAAARASLPRARP